MTIINICIYHYIRDLLFQTKSWNVSVLDLCYIFLFNHYSEIAFGKQFTHLDNFNIFLFIFSRMDNLNINSINSDMLLPRNNIKL